MAIIAIVIGLLVGTLNSDTVSLNLLWVQFELPLGLAILLGFSVGLLSGLGAVYFGRVLPLRLKLRKARAALTDQDRNNLLPPDD